jgi:hypothetical protein
VNINASDIVSKLGNGNVKIMGNCITISSAVSYTTNARVLELDANTGNVIINESLTLNGPITINGGDIQINQNINTSSGNTNGDISIKSSVNIVFASNRSLTTNGGDVILWSNTDGQTSNGGVYFKSSSAITTNGGHIWIGGGNGTSNWNNLTVGNGYAVSGRSVLDMGYVGTTQWQSGVAFNQASLNSGGGNIYIAGQRNSSASSDLGAGIINYSGTGTSIDCGNGTITIKGDNTASGRATFGIMTGLDPFNYTGRMVIRSSNNNTSNAITIEGTTSNGTGDGILIENHTRILSTATSNGGGISIIGSSVGTNNALSIGTVHGNGILEILSANGNINVNAGAFPISIFNSSSFFRLGSIDSDPNVSNSSANINIIFKYLTKY